MLPPFCEIPFTLQGGIFMISILLAQTFELSLSGVEHILIKITAILEVLFVILNILQKVIPSDTKLGKILTRLSIGVKTLDKAIEEELDHGKRTEQRDDTRGASKSDLANARGIESKSSEIDKT